jgi:PAS domain S-box-containing protein
MAAFSEAHYAKRPYLRQGDNPLGECDQTGRFTEVNRGFCAISGYERDELLQMTLFDLTHAEDAVGERPVFQKHVSGALPTYSLDKRYIRKDGTTVWVHVAASGVFDQQGTFQYGVRVVQDITERKAAEARQNLLLRELHHRVKNTLATVQAIAGSTIKASENMDQFRTAFTDRLVSLGKTHTLLTEGAWAGISLIQLLRLELDPFDDNSTQRVLLTGDDVILSPEAAVPLGMAFHELTTNAVKYGALSVLGGSLEVKWEFDAHSSRLLLIWQELNGPPVTEPRRRGFGSQLLERVLGQQLRGKVSARYVPEGLCVVVEGEVGQAYR